MKCQITLFLALSLDHNIYTTSSIYFKMLISHSIRTWYNCDIKQHGVFFIDCTIQPITHISGIQI